MRQRALWLFSTLDLKKQIEFVQFKVQVDRTVASTGARAPCSSLATESGLRLRLLAHCPNRTHQACDWCSVSRDGSVTPTGLGSIAVSAGLHGMLGPRSPR